MKFLKYFESGANVIDLNKALMNAVGENDIDRVRDLLIDGANVNFVDSPNGFTPLHLACDIRFYSENGIKTNEKIIKLLIKYGADLNALDAHGETPMMCCNKFHKVKILLDNGADFFVENKEGKNYLEIVLDELFDKNLGRDEESLSAYKEIIDWFESRYPKLMKEWYLRKEVGKYNL